jgi:hypothetical protein
MLPFEGMPLKKSTERAIRNIEEGAVVKRAQLRAQAALAKEVIDFDETASAYRAEQRLNNAAHLISKAVQHNNGLDHQITQTCKDKPALEMQNRALQETYVAGAQRLIYGYMAR